jgi:hypothetical protein
MKKNLVIICSTLLFSLPLFTGCKKEIRESAVLSQEADQAGSREAAQKNTCRLVRWQGLDNGFLRTFHYNVQGLLDQGKDMNPGYGVDMSFTFEYDNNKRVSKMKYYDHNNFLYTVIPVYKSGRITKELWYVAGTHTLDDKVVNTYDAKGEIVKRESLKYYYYYRITYDAIGNITRGDLLGKDGTFYQADILSYDKPVREPMNAVPGLPYPIPYINYMISRQKFTYYKFVYPDAEGNLITGYELDPDKSTLRAGPDHYAVYYKSFDKVSELSNTQIWRYKNCDCDNEEEPQKFAQPATDIYSAPHTNMRPPQISMLQMREIIKQARKQKGS